jgi:folylpolyglutamate synthase/dihydropteroate synthase
VALPAPRAIVLAVSSDKDVSAMAGSLAGLTPRALVLATRSRSGRALAPARVVEAVQARGLACRAAPDVGSACREALAHAGPAGLALLTGSLFAVGEAMEALGGAPGEWQ